MKKIIYVTFALLFGTVIYSCSDASDCVCPVNEASNIVMKKATSQVEVSNWDGDCSDITNEDLDGEILNGSCVEE